MEKTLTINISGWVFNVTEDAFQKLTDYFKQLKLYFEKQEDGSEIVMDIEYRVAELFKERIKEKESVISASDVEEIIAIMGQPYEMDEEDADIDAEPKKMKKKLFRDPFNSHIGGVAAGLGKYMNLDPLIIRILFILLLTTGGIGIILYITLWILIPEASTTSDRIRMEGKKVNVENIESKVREEADYIKERITDFSDEAKDFYHKTGPARRTGLKRLEIFFQALGRGVLRVLKFILGLLLFFSGIGFLIAFMILYFNWTPSLHFHSFFIDGMSFPEFVTSFLLESKYPLITIIVLTIVVLIPIIMLIFHGVRFLFNLRRNKTVGSIAWQTWLVALIVSVGLTYSSMRAFKSGAINITKHSLGQVKSDTLQVNLNTVSYYQDIISDENFEVVSQDINFPILQDGQFYGVPKLEFIATDKEHFEMKLYLSSDGKDDEQAHQYAQNIIYHFEIDSLGLTIDPYFSLLEGAKVRNQNVRMKIFIPEGKVVSLDRNIRLHFRISPYSWPYILSDMKTKRVCWQVLEDKFEILKESSGESKEQNTMQKERINEIHKNDSLLDGNK